MQEILESKNVKRFYVPKTVVLYFSDSDLTIFDDFTKSIVEYTEFIQIGTNNRSQQSKKVNAYSEKFFPWHEFRKNEKRIMKPSLFFCTIGSEIINILKESDIVVIVYKSNDETTLEYVDELSSIMYKHDVFAFHFVVETFIQSAAVKKQYGKLIKNIARKRQVYVPIKEESIVLAYQNSSISNRNHYINVYINNLIDLFISPFLDPKRNPDAFSRTKALFYQSKRNFESKVVTSMGYSDVNVDNIDLALIQALSNPMFAAAFDASSTFIVDVKMPYVLDSQIERIKYVLKAVVGDWKQFYVNTYVGPFDYCKYCQISIMAINVDDSKLITDSETIDTFIKKILNNVQKSRNLFENNETKEIILEKRIDVMEG